MADVIHQLYNTSVQFTLGKYHCFPYSVFGRVPQQDPNAEIEVLHIYLICIFIKTAYNI